MTQPFGFSTKRYDAQTGLICYGFRFYEPEISRWLTRDPLGEAGGMNLYAFVGNNPVNWVDPDGLRPIGWIIKLTKAGFKKIRPLLSKKAAMVARRKGQNVILKRKQLAKAVEKAAHGGKDLLKHKGHELADGVIGKPHFQTRGKPGHSFWGDITFLGFIGSFNDPFDDIKGELAKEEDFWDNYVVNPRSPCYPGSSCVPKK